MFEHSTNLEPDPDYALIQEAVGVMNTYLLVLGTSFSLFSKTSGKMERDGKFGISSEVVVLVILTIRPWQHFMSWTWSRSYLFKLASYVLLKRGDNGSMGDQRSLHYL